MEKCDLCGCRLFHTTFITPLTPYTGYKCSNLKCRFPFGSKYPTVSLQSQQ
jgi:hypothetical protein